jgi:hypothetical protein
MYGLDVIVNLEEFSYGHPLVKLQGKFELLVLEA